MGSWRRLVPIGLLLAATAIVAGSAALGAVQAPTPSAPAVAPPESTTVPSTAPPPPSTTAPPPPPSTTLAAIAFFNPEHGYGVFTRTDGATCTDLVALTNDGGVHFSSPVTATSSSCEAGAPVSALAFDNHGDGFLYGPELFVTHDGGANWTQSQQPGRVLSVEALGDSVWMLEAASCPQGANPSACPMRLLVSSDGGRSWAPSPSMPPGAVVSPFDRGVLGQTPLVRLSPSSAYLLTNPKAVNGTFGIGLWFTADGGRSWSPRPSPCAARQWAAVLSAAPDGTLWAVCAWQPGAGQQPKSVARSFDGGRTWTTQVDCFEQPARQSSRCATLDSGYLGGLDAVSATQAFMVGDRLPLLATDDGGTTWTAFAHALGFDASGGAGTEQVIFFDANHGVVLSVGTPALWSTSDGGQHWSSVVPSFTNAPSVPSSGEAPACTASQLSVTAGRGVAGLGNVGQAILFENVGASPCTLTGYPGVTALDASGRHVLQASWTPNGYLGGVSSGQPLPVVTVEPHQAVSALVEGTDVPPGVTACPAASALLVTPPGTTSSVRLAFQMPLCSGLQVHPVVSGVTGGVW